VTRARLAGFTGAAALAVLPSTAHGDAMSAGIQAGATELGLSGSAVRNGDTTITLGVRGGRFVATGGSLLAIEAEADWNHVRELDGLDVLASLQWLPRTEGSVLPFAGLVAGVRQEWVGSFQRGRAPWGAAVGVRVLSGRSAGLRVEVRTLRLAGDSVGDASEVRVRFGVSLLLGNDVP